MLTNSILENLESFPSSSDDYLWCDYVELLCLTSVDAKCSAGNLLELIEGGGETNPPVDSAADEDDEDGEVLDEDVESIEAFESGEDDFILRPDPVSSARDAGEAKSVLVYTSLAYRRELFGDSYPFTVDVVAKEISLCDDLTEPQLLYLQLLLSSSLRYVPNKRRRELTDPFEQLSAIVFAHILPDGWQVHRFGAKAATRYKGHLFDRLEKLAVDIRGDLVGKRSYFKTRNSGDGGLDIVAWHPLGDSRVGIPIALAQCGCTAEEWPLKSLEASPSKLGTLIHVLHPWATYYFLPLDLAKPANEWHRRSQMAQAIMIDRFRLLYIATKHNVAAACVTARDVVEEAMLIKRAA